MITSISLEDSNRKSLQMWAAYSSRSYKKRHPKAESATLGTASEPVPKGLSTIPAPVGGAKVVSVNLSGELSEEEKKMVDELKKRDTEVRRHEQAHLMAAGPYTLGAPHYTYQVGPDGQRYAVGGEVNVDLTPVEDDPEATLRKAQQLQQAALAPAEPSAADRNVAMQASRIAQEARREILQEHVNEMQGQPNPAKKAKSDSQTSGEIEATAKSSDADSSDSTVQGEDNGPARADPNMDSTDSTFDAATAGALSLDIYI